MERKLIGQVGVDSGQVWIGDPCYVLHADALPKTLGNNWGEFCDLLGESNTKQFPYELGHEGLGVCVSTAWGDGMYPVYAEVEKGRILRVTIDFDADDPDATPVW